MMAKLEYLRGNPLADPESWTVDSYELDDCQGTHEDVLECYLDYPEYFSPPTVSRVAYMDNPNIWPISLPDRALAPGQLEWMFEAADERAADYRRETAAEIARAPWLRDIVL